MKDSEIIEQMRALMVPIVNKVAELEQRIEDVEDFVDGNSGLIEDRVNTLEMEFGVILSKKNGDRDGKKGPSAKDTGS